jgi:hypothetical protein
VDTGVLVEKEQRTATVSTRVTEDEYKELEALAEGAGRR